VVTTSVPHSTTRPCHNPLHHRHHYPQHPARDKPLTSGAGTDRPAVCRPCRGKAAGTRYRRPHRRGRTDGSRCTLFGGLMSLESECHVTTDGQSASLSWNKAPIWSLGPYFYYSQTAAGLLVWGALSDERTELSFTTAAGPCQRSHSQVRVQWDSRPYFTVSDLRLPFLSPPTTRRVMVEVFDPASTRDTTVIVGFSLYSLWSDLTENTFTG
jgi:hypothetical protein